MGIDRATITSLVRELIQEGQVYEGDTMAVPRGRRPRMLHMRSRDRLVIAVDVRFSRTYVLLSDFAGVQLALETFPTTKSPEEFIGALATRICRILDTHSAVGRCEGIGLVMPGLLDRQTGRVIYSVQLGWRDVDVDVRDALSLATGLPVHMENAPIACALAQMWLGRRGGEMADNFVYVTIHEGVGTGIVANRELVRGQGFAAGEFGHVLIDPNGPRCLCGARGCWEAHTSNLATIGRYLGRELSSAAPAGQVDDADLTIQDLITRARMGDSHARDAILETGRFLGIGLAMIINVLNPDRIFLGGEITAAWDLIEPQARVAITERTLTPSAAGTLLIPDQDGEHARLRGAIALVAAPVFAAPEVA